MDSAGSLRTSRRVLVSQQVSHSQSTPHAHQERETRKGPTWCGQGGVVTHETVSSSCVVSSAGSPAIEASGISETDRPGGPYTTSVRNGRFAPVPPAQPLATPLPSRQLGNAGLPGHSQGSLPAVASAIDLLVVPYTNNPGPGRAQPCQTACGTGGCGLGVGLSRNLVLFLLSGAVPRSRDFVPQGTGRYEDRVGRIQFEQPTTWCLARLETARRLMAATDMVYNSRMGAVGSEHAIGQNPLLAARRLTAGSLG